MLNMLIQQLQEQTTSTYVPTFAVAPGAPAARPGWSSGPQRARTAQNHPESLKTTQNHSKPLKIAQNRSESLRIAQIRFKLTQNHENPVNLESFWATYSRFCLRSRDQHSNICSNSCRTECQHANINICSKSIQHLYGPLGHSRIV